MPLVLLLALNGLLAFAGWRAGTVTGGGAVAGFVVGVGVAAGLGWPGYALLLLYFGLAVAATRIGWESKSARGLAEPSGGARGAGQVVANGGPPLLFAALAGAPPPPFGPSADPSVAAAWQVAVAAGFSGALAAAAADTVSSEIGKAFGGRPRRIPDLSPAPVGTSGAVSVLGSLAGLAAALAVAAAAALWLLPPGLLVVVATAGFWAAFLEGLLAPLERRGILDNDGVNTVSVFIGGLVAAGSTWLLPRIGLP